MSFDIYTCPMHPEIKQDNPGKCPKCGMNLETGRKSFFSYFRKTYLIYFLLAAVAFYLIIYHRPHLIYVLLFLLFLSCPLMHMFHHQHKRKR